MDDLPNSQNFPAAKYSYYVYGNQYVKARMNSPNIQILTHWNLFVNIVQKSKS